MAWWFTAACVVYFVGLVFATYCLRWLLSQQFVTKADANDAISRLEKYVHDTHHNQNGQIQIILNRLGTLIGLEAKRQGLDPKEFGVELIVKEKEAKEG